MLTNWIRVNNRAAIWREMYVMRFVDTRKTPRTPFYLYARIHFIRCQMNRFTRICGNRVKALNDNATKKNKNSRKQNNNLLGTSERNNWSASRCIFLLHFSAIPSNFPLVCVLFIFEVLFFAPLRPPFPSLTRCPVFIHQLVASFFLSSRFVPSHLQAKRHEHCMPKLIQIISMFVENIFVRGYMKFIFVLLVSIVCVFLCFSFRS